MAEEITHTLVKAKPRREHRLLVRLRGIPLPVWLIAPTFLIVFGLLVYPMLFGSVLGFFEPGIDRLGQVQMDRAG